MDCIQVLLREYLEDGVHSSLLDLLSLEVAPLERHVLLWAVQIDVDFRMYMDGPFAVTL